MLLEEDYLQQQVMLLMDTIAGGTSTPGPGKSSTVDRIDFSNDTGTTPTKGHIKFC